MWLLPPARMCRQHLLGEHVECHMLAASLRMGKSIAGHLAAGQLDPSKLDARHAELAAEIARRGWNHKSPLVAPDVAAGIIGNIDPAANRLLLAERCGECRKRLEG